jgi:hypothetical protein
VLFLVNGFIATIIGARTTRLRRPHQALTSAHALRVHRISPRVRDVANAPWVDEMRGVMGVIWVTREAEYFL